MSAVTSIFDDPRVHELDARLKAIHDSTADEALQWAAAGSFCREVLALGCTVDDALAYAQARQRMA